MAVYIWALGRWHGVTRNLTSPSMPANDSLNPAAAFITQISLEKCSAWLPLLTSRIKELPWKASGQQSTLTGTCLCP